MTYREYKILVNFISSVDESKYMELDSYFEVLDAAFRVNNQNLYIIDFYKKEISSVSENPIFIFENNKKEIKKVGIRFKDFFASINDYEVIFDIISSWIKFILEYPVDERKSFSLKFNYCLDKVLLKLTLTPIFLCNDGRPWLVLCSTSISSESKPGKAIIYKKDSPKLWKYNTETKLWSEGKKIKLNEIEKSVLRLSVQGKKESEICDLIFRSKDGLKSIKRKLFRKLDVNNITEAVSYAISNGLI